MTEHRENHKSQLAKQLGRTGSVLRLFRLRGAASRGFRSSLWTATAVAPIALLIVLLSHTRLPVIAVALTLSLLPLGIALVIAALRRDDLASVARWADRFGNGHHPIASAYSLCEVGDDSPFAHAAIADGLLALRGTALPETTRRPAFRRYLKPAVILGAETLAMIAISIGITPRAMADFVFTGATARPASQYASVTEHATSTLTANRSTGARSNQSSSRPIPGSNNVRSGARAVSHQTSSIAPTDDARSRTDGDPLSNDATAGAAPKSTSKTATDAPRAATPPPPASANQNDSKTNSNASSTPPPASDTQQSQPQAANIPLDSKTDDTPPPQSSSANSNPPPPADNNHSNDRGQAIGSALPKKSRGVAPLLLEMRQPDLFEGRRLPGDADRRTFDDASPPITTSTTHAGQATPPTPPGIAHEVTRYDAPPDLKTQVADYFAAYQKAADASATGSTP